jgi:hypothetical protein
MYSSTQRKDDVWSADFIQDKGEGQIFLLHEPSGVGKTYTTECVSELTGWWKILVQMKKSNAKLTNITSGRPLVTLSVANIGKFMSC